MSTRTSSAAALLLLAACSSEASEAPPADDPSRIACALDGVDEFVRDCWVEQHRTAAGLQLVVRHPDGSFRVFDVLTDGHGLATADGADAAQVALADGGIEVAVGAGPSVRAYRTDGTEETSGPDRYRFPATIAGREQR